MTEIKNVILVGAGGNLGPTMLRALTNSPQKFSVSILTRGSSTSVLPRGVPVHKTDYSYDSLVSAFRGKDAVVSAVGAMGIMDQTKMIDAAIDAGVQRFVPSQFGSDSYNEVALRRVPIVPAKKAILEYLREKEEKISWTAIEHGAFTDWGLKVGIFGFDISTSTAKLYTPHYHETKFSGTTLATTGLAVVRSLESESVEQTRNKDLFVSGTTFSQDDILASLEKATGKQWIREEVNLDDAIDDANVKIARFNYSGYNSLILGMIMDPESGCNFEERGNVVNGMLNLPQERLDEVVRQVLADSSK